MPAFAGLRGTGNWATDERPKNFRELILWLNPNGKAPLTALLAKAKKESVDDPEFAWFQEKLSALRVMVNYSTGYSDTDNTLVLLADGLRLVPGDVVQVEKTETATYDNELMEVSSVTDDTTVVFKRGVAGSAAAAITDGTYLTQMGSAWMEGTLAPELSQRNPTKLYNYTQIFKTAVGLTRTASKTRLRTGDAYKNDKKRKSFDHATGMEFAFLFGQRYEDTTGTHPKRYTGGMRQWITTNVKIYTTTPTEDDFLDVIHKVFDYDSDGAGNERIGLCGNGFLNALNKLAKSGTQTRINFDKVIDLYGMNLQRWITPQGVFAFKTHPLMNTHPRYTYSAFILDPTGLYYRPLDDTRFKDNIQENDRDAKKGEWLTEAGLEVHHEETMCYIGNFDMTP